MSKRKKKHPEKPLSETQKKAVAMLYDCYSIKEIAEACGVHRCTIWRWENLRGFRKEYQRIDRNWRRRIERQEAKRRAEEDRYWSEKLREAEENMRKEAANIHGKPSKAYYKACSEWEKALCRGLTLSQLFDLVFSDKPLRIKRRRR